MSADRPAPAPDTVTDDLRMVAYRSARAWAAEYRHPQPDDRMIDAVLNTVVPLIRERLAAEMGRTCQETAPSVFANDSRIHECAREAGHRSPKHRCACGCEWWLRADAATVDAEPCVRPAEGHGEPRSALPDPFPQSEARRDGYSGEVDDRG